MLYRVLGTLEFRAGEHWTPIGAAKWRSLLAALVLRPGQVVATEQLVDELWGENPPPAARKLVASYVLRLRRLTGDPAGRVLVTRAPGYQLMVARAEVDALQFEDLLGAGRHALRDQDPDRAAELLSAALALWRGAALADVPPGPLATTEADRLEELRVDAVELRVDAGMRGDSRDDLVPELRRLTIEHPLRERFWYQLMSLLAQGGRQAEALAAYARAREVIAAELGTEPGHQLQELHRRLLSGQPAAVSPPADASGQAAGGGPAVPRQLPAAVRGFSGRAAELRQLAGLLGEAPRPGGAIVISAVGGTAGVGKTALAVQWAHRVAEDFPDGQLYVNLRGYDPGLPMPPADALAGFLRALGVAGADIPADPDERAARYRSLLAGRRVLVVLDNAGSAEQVRPLLPGTSSCVALVTSRDTLAGLVARDGAVRLDLEPLQQADAVGLLTTLIGSRAAGDPAATGALARRCARLPLALRVAAELAASRPRDSLAGLAGELADQQRQLDLLDAGGDPRAAVRAVFSWSCRRLDPGGAEMFRLAALHPGPDLDAYAAAALADTTPEQASHLLTRLARAYLIQPAAPGRYGMHDLLRAYARELGGQQDTAGRRRAAVTRLLDHYLHAAATAQDILVPSERDRRPRVPSSATAMPPMAGPRAARRWLDAERASLVAAVAHADEHGWPGQATDLSLTLLRYFQIGGHNAEALAVHDHARRAARRAGDDRGEASALYCLGMLGYRQGRSAEAAARLEQALALFRRCADPTGQAMALGNLGLLDTRLGRFQESIDRSEQALAIFREIGDAKGVASVLGNLGAAEQELGRYEQAARYFQEALALCREIGDRSEEGQTLGRLGDLDLTLGRYTAAARRMEECLAVFGEIGQRPGQAEACVCLGEISRQQDDPDRAALYFEQALAFFQELGELAGQARAHVGLGDVLLATGQPGRARAHYAAAVDLAGQTGSQLDLARGQNGLGHSYHAAGDLPRARQYWQEALACFARLGNPEAERVQARLAATGRAT